MKHTHAIKLLNRALKNYERELERIILIRNTEDVELIQSHISELKQTIKHLEHEGLSNQNRH